MGELFSFVLGYLFLLICWVIINLLFFTLSFVTKKSLFYIPLAVNTVISWIIGIYFFVLPFYILWQLLVLKAWIPFVLVIVFGWFFIGIYKMIVEFFIAPFSWLTLYFSEKAIQKINIKNSENDFDLITSDGKVMTGFRSDDKLDKSLAKWFLIAFFAMFIQQFIDKDMGELGAAWYIATPMITLVILTLLATIPVAIWNLLKKRGVWGGNKKIFLTSCLKVSAIYYILNLIGDIVLRYLFSLNT